MSCIRNYLLFVSLGCLFACANSSEELLQTRDLPSFEAIEINSSFEIVLLEGAKSAVRLKGAESRLNKIRTSVENGMLKITDENNVKWMAPGSNKIELLITAPRFSALTVNETCLIRSAEPLVSGCSIIMGNRAKLIEAHLELNGGNFYYWNNFQCGGRLTLSGNASSIQLSTFSSMSVDAERLTARHARIESNSKGSCTITVSDQLDYSIRGIGNIYFRGNPQIKLIENTSTGQLIKLD